MGAYKFKRGDRVVLARPDEVEIDVGLRRGDTGTVEEDFLTRPFVTFDGKPTDGCVFAISEKHLDHLGDPEERDNGWHEIGDRVEFQFLAKVEEWFVKGYEKGRGAE